MKPLVTVDQLARLVDAYASQASLDRPNHVKASIASGLGIVEVIAACYNGVVVDGQTQPAVINAARRALRATHSKPIAGVPFSAPPTIAPETRQRLSAVSGPQEAVKGAQRGARAVLREAEAVLRDASVEAADRLIKAEARAADLKASAERSVERRTAELLKAAKVDALETRADEAMSARMARKNALNACALASLALAQARVVAERPLSAVELAAMTPKDRVSYMRAVAGVVSIAGEAAIGALKYERLRVGDPSETIELKIVREELSPEECAREIEEAAALLEIARARGLVPSSPKSPPVLHVVADEEDPPTTH